MDRRIAQDKIIGFALGLGKQDRTATGSDFSGDIDTNIPTLNLAAGDGDDITQPVGTEYTIDKAVGLTIGKTDLNATYKTIGAKTL
jgi:tRNA U34 2-thiouridine synthase MnmA/TrmU